MRFHYMERGSVSAIDSLKDLSKDLDSAGYYSLLLTYHSNNYDFLTKSLLAADNDINLKFMIAIRTYAISPEYMAMICRSYNDSFPNKLILNVVSGDIHEDEHSINNIVMFGDSLATPESRLPYTNEWIKKFLDICKKWYTPEIIMGGHSDQTRTMCNIFNFTHLSALNMHLDHIKKSNYIKNDKQMVATSILIRDTDQEAQEFLFNNCGKGADQWTIAGSEKYVIEKILALKNIGVTDLIISKSMNDNQSDRVHKLIKYLTTTIF